MESIIAFFWGVFSIDPVRAVILAGCVAAIPLLGIVRITLDIAEAIQERKHPRRGTTLQALKPGQLALHNVLDGKKNN